MAGGEALYYSHLYSDAFGYNNPHAHIHAYVQHRICPHTQPNEDGYTEGYAIKYLGSLGVSVIG